MKKINIVLLALLGLLCISVNAMAQVDFAEGLVLYLPLDEDEGEEAIDASGNGNNGTITPPTTGEWHFIAATYDRAAMKFYMDGQKTSECPLVGKINAPGTNIVIGSTGWGPAMVGIYDDIRIYKIAFLEEEIKDLYEYVPEELSINPHISIPSTWAGIKGRY